MGALCPICLGTGAGGLTAGLPGSALVLLAAALLVLGALGRLIWRVWRHEAS